MFYFNPSTGCLDFSPSDRKGNDVFSGYKSNSSLYLQNVWNYILPLSGSELNGNIKVPSPLYIKDNNNEIQILNTVSTQTNFITPRYLLRIIVNGENKVIKLFDDNN